jgi:hypothetical protein
MTELNHDERIKQQELSVFSQFIEGYAGAIVGSHSVSPFSCAFGEEDFELFARSFGVDKQLCTSFRDANRMEYTDLGDAIQLPVSRLINTRHFIDVVTSGWESFFQSYPNASGALFMSRIAFDSEITTGIFYYEYFAGQLASQRGYVNLTMPTGNWIIEKWPFAIS